MQTASPSHHCSGSVGGSGLSARPVEKMACDDSTTGPRPWSAWAAGPVPYAAIALRAEQSLQLTAEGGHLAVDQAISAQFGGVLAGFSRLRRRRNELVDPVGPENFATTMRP
jgi:hypothetical protein